MKILSPAGNFESLKMAVFNGADEVYLGINEFNARNNIACFDMSTLKEAVDFAHVFNVKVSLAINILFSDEELQSALDTIVDAYNLGVDSFIIQDLGLAELVHCNYPEIEIHASTQMALHNLEGVKFVERFGFKRVVLARETPLEEIARIRKNSTVEIEYFAQGALCVSFSGNCYLSSYLCNASGNRGRCKQLCRLPYTLEKNGKKIKSGYLLSAKDFNMISKLEDLKNVGVDVLKIEGRARRPFYVAMATKEYFNALNGEKPNETNLKLSFNREYTPGYFDGNGNIISDYQSHIGIKIGVVNKIKSGRTFNEVFFSSNIPLSPKSTFKIFSNEKEQCTLTAYDLKEISKNQYRITTTHKISVGDSINLIVDEKLEAETLSTYKKRDFAISIIAEENKPIYAKCKIDNKDLKIAGPICEKANKQPITSDDLISNFNKNEFFKTDLTIEKLDSIFLPKQKLNEFRRDVFSRIFEALTEKHHHNLQKTTIKTEKNIKKFENYQIIENLSEKLFADNIVYSPESYELKDIQKFQNLCATNNKIAYLDTPNFALEADINLLKEIIEQTKIAIVANNYYALSFDTKIVIGAGLNVFNHHTANVYDKPVMTAESEISSKVHFPYMTLRHCPMKSHLNATCTNCPYCNNFSYKMDNGKILNLRRKKLSSCTFYLTD